MAAKYLSYHEILHEVFKFMPGLEIVGRKAYAVLSDELFVIFDVNRSDATIQIMNKLTGLIYQTEIPFRSLVDRDHTYNSISIKNSDCFIYSIWRDQQPSEEQRLDHFPAEVREKLCDACVTLFTMFGYEVE